jgi:hypothetical protein
MQDQDSLKICEDNRFAMEHSDEVHVWYEPTSQGSLFDIGMAFVLGKPLFIVNPNAVQPTDSKSVNNLLLSLDKKAREWKRIMEELTRVSQGTLGGWSYTEHEEGHRMRVPSTREERQQMLEGIGAEQSRESEIGDELRGMPYGNAPAQEECLRPPSAKLN